MLFPAVSGGPQEAVASAEALQASLPDFQLGEEGQRLISTLAEKFKDSPQVLQEIVNAAATLGPSIGESAFQGAMQIPVVGPTIAPAAGALAGAIPEALEAATAVKGLKTAGSAVSAAVPEIKNKPQLIDVDSGLPTPEFAKALESKGLTFGNIIDDVDQLPATVPPDQAVNQIIKAKLNEGASDDFLAELQVSPTGFVEPDKLGKAAIRQGFQKGDVQAIKVASPGTKRGMDKMLKMTRRIGADCSISPLSQYRQPLLHPQQIHR